jgi:hypothetical protein
MKINIKLKPNSKKGPLVIQHNDYYEVFVREPAVNNQANIAAIEILANHFKISKTRIKLHKGPKSHHKIFIISSD